MRVLAGVRRAAGSIMWALSCGNLKASVPPIETLRAARRTSGISWEYRTVAALGAFLALLTGAYVTRAV